MKQWNIRRGLLVLALAPALLVALCLPLYFLHRQIQDLEGSLLERGRAMTRQLAPMSEFGVLTGNRKLLQQLADTTRREPDVAAVVIRNAAGEVLAKSPAHAAAEDSALIPPELAMRSKNGGRILQFIAPIREPRVDLEDFLEGHALPPRPLGSATLELSRDGVLAARTALVLFTLAVAAGALLVGMVLAARMSLRIALPIRRLSRTVQRIGSGDLAARTPADSKGEILELERGVNAMAAQLEASRSLLERRIQEATAELHRQKEQAERANLAKTRFLAAASHDLRQPLHALGLLVAALRRAGDAGEAAEIAARIEASVAAMEELFVALMDISRLDAGGVEVHAVDFPLAPLLQRVCGEQAEEARRKGLRLKAAPTRLWAHSDPVLVERILGNLVSNAVRYTRSGGVLVGCRRRGDAVRLEVWDSGSGIPPEQREAVFEEFVQLQNPGRDRAKGLGLGLAIVRRLARLLRSGVALDSQPGRGSCFAVMLPRAEAGTVPQPAAPVAADMAQLRGSLVMVIDDDLLVRDAMERLLRGWGCFVVTAGSMAEALDCLAALEREPDAILCDYRLSEADDGFEALARLRRRLATRPLMAIVTGDTDPALARRARRARLPLLYKPVRPAELAALLGPLSQG